jgi:hypothetical protein
MHKNRLTFLLNDRDIVQQWNDENMRTEKRDPIDQNISNVLRPHICIEQMFHARSIVGDGRIFDCAALIR